MFEYSKEEMRLVWCDIKDGLKMAFGKEGWWITYPGILLILGMYVLHVVAIFKTI